MLAIISEEKSLLNLSVNDIRKIAWKHLNLTDFVDELNDLKFLERFHYASCIKFQEQFLTEILSEHMYLFNETSLQFIIDKIYSTRNNFYIPSSMFYNSTQYSLEFIVKNEKHLSMYHIEKQKSLTPEFVYEHQNDMDMNGLWDALSENPDMEKIKEYVNFNDGFFQNDIKDCGVFKFMVAEDLNNIGMTVPDYYNNIIHPQRVMSGDPCNDGQRSYSIWLRKFRREFNKPDEYPTWNELLCLYKKHPRMNHNGYIDWLYGRAAKNDDDDIKSYSTQLTIDVTAISQYDEECEVDEEEECEVSDDTNN